MTIWEDALFAWFSDCQRIPAIGDVDGDALHEGEPHGHDITYYELCNGQRIGVLFAVNTSRSPLSFTPIHSSAQRLASLSNVLVAMLSFYREELKQLIVMPLPDLLSIAQHPQADASSGEMKKVLLLLLGCAVQSDKKEEFVNRIKQLELSLQQTLVEQIQKVTSNAECVLNLQALEIDSTQTVAATVLHQLQRVIKERDDSYANLSANATIHECDEELESTSNNSSTCNGSSCHHSKLPECQQDLPSSHTRHSTLETASVKADLRTAHNQLDEANILLDELKDDMHVKETELVELREKCVQLGREARAVGDYRDEIDCLQQKVEEMNRVERHNAKLQERLNDMEMYKKKVDELHHENALLMETKTVMEEQMATWRTRANETSSMETMMNKMKNELENAKKQLDQTNDSLSDLSHKYARSQSTVTTLTEQCNQLQLDMDTASTPRPGGGLDCELQSSERQKVLQMELENQKLTTKVDQLEHDLRQMKSKEVEKGELDEMRAALDEETRAKGAMAKENEQMKALLEEAREKIAQEEFNNEELKVKLETGDKEMSETKELLIIRQIEVCQLQKEITQVNVTLHQVQEERATTEDCRSSLDSKLSSVEREKRCLEKEKLALKEKLSTVETEYESCRSRLVVLERDTDRVQELTGRVSQLTAQNVDLGDDVRQMKSQYDMERTKAIKLGDDLVECKTKLADVTGRVQNVCHKYDVTNVEQFDTVLMGRVVEKEREVEKMGRELKEKTENLEVMKNEMTMLKDQLESATENEHDSSAMANLQEENRSIKEQIVRLQENIRTANALVDAKTREVADITESMDAVKREKAASTVCQEDVARLEVQLRNAQLQGDLLRTDNDELQRQCASYDRQAIDADSTYKRLTNEHRELLADHEHLQALHERLSVDYEHLKQAQANLVATIGEMKSERASMKNVNAKVDADERAIADLTALLHKERATNEGQLRQIAQMQNDFSQLKYVNETVSAQANSLHNENDRLLMQVRSTGDAERRVMHAHTQLAACQDTLAACQEALARQDGEMGRTRKKAEIVEQLNRTLEEECHTLLRQLDSEIAQKQALITRSLLDNDAVHAGDYGDALHALKRRKERLEEKIGDQYRLMDTVDAYKKENNESSKGVGFMRRAANVFLPGRKSSRVSSHHCSEDSCDDAQSTSHVYATPTNTDEAHSDSAGEIAIHGFPTSSSSPDSSSNSSGTHHNERGIDVHSVASLHRAPPPVYGSRPPPPPYGSKRLSSNGDGMNTSIFRPAQTSTPTTERAEVKGGSLHDEIEVTEEDLVDENGVKKDSIWYEYGCV